VMDGATGEGGVPAQGAVPVVREISAYRADDRRPILAAPWILSVNANPSVQSRAARGGEWTNDVYHAKFLQRRFASLLAALRRDDKYARSLGPHGELLDVPPGEGAGEALEAIEGDDPLLDAQLLARSSPPPIVVLSGSNDWDYASVNGPDPSLQAMVLGPAARRASGRHGTAGLGRARSGRPVHGLLRRSPDPRAPRGSRPGSRFP